MSKVKRVVLGEGILSAWVNDKMVGLREPDCVHISKELVLVSVLGKRVRLVAEITEPKRKRKGTT